MSESIESIVDRGISNGSDLRSMRKELLLGPEQFAKLAGCSRHSVHRWERENCELPFLIRLFGQMLYSHRADVMREVRRLQGAA